MVILGNATIMLFVSWVVPCTALPVNGIIIAGGSNETTVKWKLILLIINHLMSVNKVDHYVVEDMLDFTAILHIKGAFC